MYCKNLNIPLASFAALALVLFSTEVSASPQLIGDQAQSTELPGDVSPSDWSSISELIRANRHAFQGAYDGYRARNPRFGWEAEFDGKSALIQPAGKDWSFGFALKAFGFEGLMQEVETPTFGTCAEGQEIVYGWSDELSEWWINDGRGLEHGFTVYERPAGFEVGEASPLIFELYTLGSLEPKVNDTRTGLSLHDGDGASVLRYDGLVAFDANGSTLSAWLEVEGRSVRICVDEAIAQYPIVVDPIVQDAYVKASNTEAGDRFGQSVAVSGDTVVVGARYEDSSATGINGDPFNNSATWAGAAYVFVRTSSSWTQQAYLKASNSDGGDFFGASVAISGDTVVVGAPWEFSTATGVDGDQSNNLANAAGAAYVFVRSGSSWTQQAYLKASNTDVADNFGQSVAVSGDTVVVGAIREDSSAIGVNGDESNNFDPDSGAAYVFVRNGAIWMQQAYLKASNTDAGDFFGITVAASGDTVVVGAPGEGSSTTGINGDPTNNAAMGSGAAYVFARSGTSWTQQAYLKASNTDGGDGFGYSVALSGDTAVIGAVNEDGGAAGVGGDHSSNSAPGSGAAYVFFRTGPSWVQQAYLKASNPDAHDQFGGSVAVSLDTAVVGALNEDSGATGTDGDQLDNSELSSGAAYVFTRSGSSWAQQAYVKASDTDFGDQFGTSVSASGHTVVVGASGEDSNATGIDGDASNNNANDSGAAYFFGGAGAVGLPYCMAAVNSTGGAGELTGSGSASVANNNLTLETAGLPAGVFGLYLTSQAQGSVMNPGGSEGDLCLGGSIGRYNGSGQIVQSDALGRFSLWLDLANTPTPFGPVAIVAGQTWNFQGWYRDINVSGPTSNFTNGLEVMFTM